MKLLNKKYYTFVMLKVVRHGDLSKEYLRSINNLSVSCLGQPCNSAYLMRFFIDFYGTIKNNIISFCHSRGYNTGMQRNYITAILKRCMRSGVTKVSIMYKRCGATSSPKPSDKTSDRLLKGLKRIGVYFHLGDGGKLLFLRSLTSFSLAGI